MSLVKTAHSQIKRYGSKNRVALLNYVSVKDAANLTISNTKTRIKLLAFVNQLTTEKTEPTNNKSKSFRVLAAIDGSFTGNVTNKSQLLIDNEQFDIVEIKKHYVKDTLSLVEFRAHG